MLRVLRNRQLTLLVAAQLLSAFGGRALLIAFGIWVKELTGSSSAAALAFVFVAGPYVFAPFAGVLIDRVSRRGLLIVTNLLMAAVLLLVLLVNSASQVWLLYAVILAYGVAGVVIISTQAALVADVVDERDLPDANGLSQAVNGAVMLLGPAVGAALFPLLGGHAIAIIDAICFVVAAGLLLALRVRDTLAEETSKPSLVRSDLLAGLAHLRAESDLRRVVTALAATMMVMGFSQTLIFTIVEDGIHRETSFIGILISLQGAGSIMAGMLIGVASRWLGDVRVVAVGIGFVTTAALLYLTSQLVFVMVAAFVFGAAICWTTAGMITVVQQRTSTDLRGRALSAAMALVSLPQTISIALGAALALVVDYRLLLVAMALIAAVCGSWLAVTVRAASDSQVPSTQS